MDLDGTKAGDVLEVEFKQIGSKTSVGQVVELDLVEPTLTAAALQPSASLVEVGAHAEC